MSQINTDTLIQKSLLYVVCSRAIKNLRVLYLGDIEEIRGGIEAIFGEAKHWPVEV
jgi:DNA helicase-2/ATP-dependent DNA helicase PcrA